MTQKRFYIAMMLGVILSIVMFPSFAGAQGADIKFLGPSTFAAPGTVTFTSDRPNLRAWWVPNGTSQGTPATLIERTGNSAEGYRFSVTFERAAVGNGEFSVRACSVGCEEAIFDATVMGDNPSTYSLLEWQQLELVKLENGKCNLVSRLSVSNGEKFVFTGKIAVQQKTGKRWKTIAKDKYSQEVFAYESPGYPVFEPPYSTSGAPLVWVVKVKKKKLGQEKTRAKVKWQIQGGSDTLEDSAKQKVKKKQCKRAAE